MNRRDFFTLRSADTAEVSCERLFVHYRDALGRDEADAFLARTATELKKARRLVLKDSYWLDERKIAAAIAPVLAEFRARGGVVERA
jgi:hypothetical protein